MKQLRSSIGLWVTVFRSDFRVVISPSGSAKMESGRNGTNPDFPEQPSIASLFPPDKSDTDASSEYNEIPPNFSHHNSPFPANKSDTDVSSEYNQIPPNFSHHNANSIVSIFPPARSQTDEIIIPNPTITSTSFSHVFPSSIGPPTIQISIPSLFPPTVSETEIDGSGSSESNEARPRVFDSIASCFPPVRSPSNGSEIYETTLDHSIASIFPAEAGFNTRDNPLRKLADAIEGLSSSVNSENPHLKISDVVQFGRLSTPSIFFLGIAFRFADLELQSKVNNLEEASKTYDTDTVQALLEGETENGSAKNTGSHCRNLVRLKRVIDLVRVMLEQVLASGDG
nr:accelerated cell death 11 [Quercus suber]